MSPEQVYISIYKTTDGVEYKISPEKTKLTVEEAIKFLQDYLAKQKNG